jgi:glutamine cyclotransferase
VKYNGVPLARLNELECVEGDVLSNIWYDDHIARINPASGVVLELIDFSDLDRCVGVATVPTLRVCECTSVHVCTCVRVHVCTFARVYVGAACCVWDPLALACLRGAIDGLRRSRDARREDVLNGIAYDPAGSNSVDGYRLYVTGKLWPRLHEVRWFPKLE